MLLSKEDVYIYHNKLYPLLSPLEQLEIKWPYLALLQIIGYYQSRVASLWYSYFVVVSPFVSPMVMITFYLQFQ